MVEREKYVSALYFANSKAIGTLYFAKSKATSFANYMEHMVMTESEFSHPK